MRPTKNVPKCKLSEFQQKLQELQQQNNSNNNNSRNQSSNLSCPKKEENTEVNNAETATQYKSDPTFSDLKSSKKRYREKRRGDRNKCPCPPQKNKTVFQGTNHALCIPCVPQTTIFLNIKIKDCTQLLVYPCTYKSHTQKHFFTKDLNTQ